jgi:hypothetical protein
MQAAADELPAHRLMCAGTPGHSWAFQDCCVPILQPELENSLSYAFAATVKSHTPFSLISYSARTATVEVR